MSGRAEVSVTVAIRCAGSSAPEIRVAGTRSTDGTEEAIDATIAEVVQNVCEQVGEQTQELFGDEEPDPGPPNGDPRNN